MPPGQRGPVPIPKERDLVKEILDTLGPLDTFKSSDEFPDVSQAEIKAALDRLASRSMIEYEQNTADLVLLEREGQQICELGSPEYRVWDAIRSKGRLGIKELAAVVGGDVAKYGQGTAMKLKLIKKDGTDLVVAKKDVKDETRQILEFVQQTKRVEDSKMLADFRKRKLVRVEKAITYTVRKGSKYAAEMPVEVTDLTADMLASEDWKTANFKPYNFNALGASQSPGALHPLMKVREEFRKIFFNQGFIEMPTSRYVDSGFWNFDALFVPQQHPARDMQDTFFISDPPKADPPRDDPAAEAAMNAMEESSRKLYASPIPRDEIMMSSSITLSLILSGQRKNLGEGKCWPHTCCCRSGR